MTLKIKTQLKKLAMIDTMNNNMFVWLGIAFCISQSAMFSGLNLTMLRISRLLLEVEVSTGNKYAQRILALRQDYRVKSCPGSVFIR